MVKGVLGFIVVWVLFMAATYVWLYVANRSEKRTALKVVGFAWVMAAVTFAAMSLFVYLF